MNKVCITGGNGFIGNNLARFLKSIDYDIFIIDNLSESYQELLPPDIKFHHCDVTDLAHVKEIFKEEKPECVFHLAAFASECVSHWMRAECERSNIIGTSNIISASVENNVKKLIAFSSIAAYGEQEPPFNEETPLKPMDIYGFTKKFNEDDIKLAYEFFGLKYNIIRAFNVCGGRFQNCFSAYRNALAIWCRQVIWEGGDITVYGDGSQKRSFSSVDYILPVLEKLVHNCDNEIFNLGSEKPITIYEAAKIVRDVAYSRGYHAKIKFLEQRKEVKFAYCDTAKAKNLLNFQDDTDLKKTVEEMFDWMLTQKYRKPSKMEYEVNKNLYSFWR